MRLQQPDNNGGRDHVAMLMLVSARRAEREVRSILSYFVAERGRKGASCTSAS